jgi:hypothetical protein
MDRRNFILAAGVAALAAPARTYFDPAVGFSFL